MLQFDLFDPQEELMKLDDIANMLRKRRIELGYTIPQVAKAAGINRFAYLGIENCNPKTNLDSYLRALYTLDFEMCFGGGPLDCSERVIYFIELLAEACGELVLYFYGRENQVNLCHWKAGKKPTVAAVVKMLDHVGASWAVRRCVG